MNEYPSRQTLLEWDAAYLWHPFTPHAVYLKEDPLVIAKGEGNYLVDIDGKRYLDGVASLWCNTFGHRVPAIDRAVRRQLDRIAHTTLLGNTSPPAVVLAKRLCELAPDGLDKVFFSDNGSTAVEVALKMTYQYWQHIDGHTSARKKFLALANAYHGDTMGAVSVGGIDLFHRSFESMAFEVIRAPVPYPHSRPTGVSSKQHLTNCLKAVEELFAKHGRSLAAAILEPRMQGAGGMLVYPAAYLEKIVELCRRHGTMVIFDEVATGMGRSGALFACQQEGITPDLLCIAKGLTGGYLPLAATLTTRPIFEAFLGPPEQGRTFFHGHTYTGNALATAAALATLDLFEQERIIERLQLKISLLGEELEQLRTLPNVGDVRQYGLAAGVELVADPNTGQQFPAAQRRGVRVCLKAREKGVFLRPLGEVIVLMPPLSISHDEIRTLVGAVAWAIQQEMGA